MRIGLFFIILFLSHSVFAQIVEKDDLAPCGTPNFITDFMIEYKQKGEATYLTKSDSLLMIPISIHILGSDSGTSYYDLGSMYDALCQLNLDFEQVNVQFFIAGEILYHDRSEYLEHEDVLQGADMMFEYNVENTLNCYIVRDPAGNCGYNLPYAGVALSVSCIGLGERTWSHELGHAFTVQHPFLGWEGNQLNPSDTAPEKLLYNYTYFKDTLIRDTLILDTAYTERVDGSNCSIAADKHCDTPPDFIARRWTCNADGMSSFEMTDAKGQKFRAEGKFIMNYANDECQHEFSIEQINQMRSNILYEKNYSDNYSIDPIIDESETQVYYPVNGDTIDIEDVMISWGGYKGVSQYSISIGVGAALAGVKRYITSDTSMMISDFFFRKGLPYHFKIQAFNNSSFCSDPLEGSFFVDDLVSTQDKDFIMNSIEYPNLVSKGEALRVSNKNDFNVTCKLYNINGYKVWDGVIRPRSMRSIPVQLSGGLYFIEFLNNSKRLSGKIVAQ